jgi:glycosyltransferase involved in cell wall biosynthesis
MDYGLIENLPFVNRNHNQYILKSMDIIVEKKFKLLLVSPLPPPSGGIQTVTDTLVSYLKNNHIGIDICVHNTSHRLRPPTSQALGIRLLTGIIKSLGTYFAVRRFVRRTKPDIIHLSSSSSFALIKDLMIVTYAKHRQVPVIMHWHFGRIPELALKNNWEWRLLQLVITKSAASIVLDDKSYYSLLYLGIQNLFLIPNPLPLAVEKKMRDLLFKLQRSGVEQRGSGRVIFAGHIIKEKGVYELVEACSQISSVKELVLIGHFENSVRNDLVRIASIRADENWFQMTGELSHDQTLEIMSHSSILALPSYTEGFPMVVIEGMAMGCAIIGSDVGAIPEMLDASGKSPCGLCIPVKNVEKLKNVISELIDNYDELSFLSNNGKDRIMRVYNAENIIMQYKTAWYKASRK